jgi:uncharacterized DUF497 family protein
MTDTVSVPEFEGFDGSSDNAATNWDRHRVTPLEAEQVFFHTPLLVRTDLAHSQTGSRCTVLGQTDEGRELFIAFVVRGKRVRVVSARDMSRKERKAYRS